VAPESPFRSAQIIFSPISNITRSPLNNQAGLHKKKITRTLSGDLLLRTRGEFKKNFLQEN
jgi:hypothetical protein